MVSTGHIAKSVPNRTSAKKIHMGAYHRRGGCFFQGVGTGKNLNKKHFL